jgi:hypothetical protein
MILANTLLRKVYELWGGISDRRLPIESVLSVMNRVTAQVSVEMQLSGMNFFAKITVPFTMNPNTRSKPLAGFGEIDIPFRVESRGIGSNSEDSWVENTIWNYADWNNANDHPNLAVSFTGVGDSLTMFANRDALSTQFRVAYQTNGGINSFTESATGEIASLPATFQYLMEYWVALECGLLIQDDSPEFQNIRQLKMAYLAQAKHDSMKSLEKWIQERKPSSVGFAEPFNSKRLNPNRLDGIHGVRFNGY